MASVPVTPVLVAMGCVVCVYMCVCSSHYTVLSTRRHPAQLLRGTIVSRTYGTHKNLPGIYLPFFTNNIWPYSLWSSVIASVPILQS